MINIIKKYTDKDEILLTFNRICSIIINYNKFITKIKYNQNRRYIYGRIKIQSF